MNKTKIIFFLLLLFSLLNVVVYLISELQKREEIESEQQKKLLNLQTHYKALIYNQTIIADAAYVATIANPKFMDIFTKTKDASESQKNLLRQQLYTLLKPKYETLVMKGALQYQFILPNSESFLRLHKPNKFGDLLSNIREDIAYTNRTKLPIRGLTQGRVSHGFRNAYPIFGSDGSYLGVVEISFSSENIQNNLTYISNIHTHFLVQKTLFNTALWQLNDSVFHYTQSFEHQDFMLSINKNDIIKHSFFENKKSLKYIQKNIDRGMQENKEFSLYVESNNIFTIISFIPIFNIEKNETIAWLGSYEDSGAISQTLSKTFNLRLLFFFIFLALMLLLYKLIISNQKVKEEHKLINDILSTTDDIIFITDFQRVTYCNKKFKKFFCLNNTQEFENLYPKSIDIFLKDDGYLHKGLLKDNETFVELIEKTEIKNRVVLLRDNYLTNNSFAINIANISSQSNKSYLVTLTDITKLKEYEKKILKQAYTDELTGIHNRAKLSELFAQELFRARRHKAKLSMCIIDIDHFKRFNDTYGHLIGDEVLIMLTKTLRLKIREYDIIARWGGEEFVILFPETSKEEAVIISNKLRKITEETPHPSAGVITASFGVAQLLDNDTLDTLFERCDRALYLAKERGRNRVESI